MIRILIVMLGLLSAGQRVEAAPWALPPGVKTLEVNGYPMAFLESGTGEPVVLVHGSATDYRSGHDRWHHRRAAFGSLQ
jgi:hypothetical protein